MNCHGAVQQPIELDAAWLVDEVAVASLLDPECQQNLADLMAFLDDALELAVVHVVRAYYDD